MSTSAKPDDLPPHNDKKEKADSAETESFRDELEGRCDDLFGLGDEDAERRQITKTPIADVKETPRSPKTVYPGKDKTGETGIGDTPALLSKKGVVSSTPKAPAAVDFKKTNGQQQKEAAPSVRKAHPESNAKVAAVKKKPVDQSAKGMAPKAKPNMPETEPAQVAGKPFPQKSSQPQVKIKRVESTIKRGKIEPKQGKKKHALLKLILGGILLVGGVLSFFTFYKPPDPSPQGQLVVAPKAHKIIKPPEKVPEAKPAPPVAAPIAQQPEAAPIESESTPAAASPKDEKTAIQTTPPEIGAVDEIEAFLQEWRSAWERSAGTKGDMDAFMSFYSEDFNSNGFNKNKFRQDKAGKNRRKEWIRVKLDGINILGPLGNDRYEASFKQVYQSSNYSDTKSQILILKKEAAEWKIIGIKSQTPATYPYSIHGGSYRTLPPARKVVEAYRKMGLEAYWVAVDLGEKGIWYRVFIGYYKSFESAQEIITGKALSGVRPQNTQYANLIGTYSSKNALQRQRRIVTESGYSSYVILDDNGNLNLYAGAFVSLKNAEKSSAELNDRGIPSQVVSR